MNRIRILLLLLILSLTLNNWGVFAQETSGSAASKAPKKSGGRFFWNSNPKISDEVKSKSKAQKPSKTELAKSPALKVNTAVSSVRPENVADINQQLQNIIRINDSIKAGQAVKIAQLQSIQEQAKIHQQILRTLEVSKAANPVFNPTDIQEVLRQEKIRLIREQTTRNSEIVKVLAQQKRS